MCKKLQNQLIYPSDKNYMNTSWLWFHPTVENGWRNQCVHLKKSHVQAMPNIFWCDRTKQSNRSSSIVRCGSFLTKLGFVPFSDGTVRNLFSYFGFLLGPISSQKKKKKFGTDCYMSCTSWSIGIRYESMAVAIKFWYFFLRVLFGHLIWDFFLW